MLILYPGPSKRRSSSTGSSQHRLDLPAPPQTHDGVTGRRVRAASITRHQFHNKQRFRNNDTKVNPLETALAIMYRITRSFRNP